MEFSSILPNILELLSKFVTSLNTAEIITNLVEVVLLGITLYYVYQRYIKGTTSENLVKGVLVLFVIWLIAEALVMVKLQIFGIVLKAFVLVIIFGLIVVFQPELRRLLLYLGQGNLFRRVLLNQKPHRNKDKYENIVKELIETIKYLSKTRTGALFVVNSQEDFSSTYEVGVEINADISQELLLTIFHPNTPLHDGAVVITDGKIKVAGALLPLTEDPKLSWRYGTRHRAAIGASEVSNCACIVVSEETGDVSVAIDGNLKKCEDLAELKTMLERIFVIDEDEEKALFFMKSRKEKEN